MKGELKAGGLALVYGLRVRTEANGKSVRLIEIASQRFSDVVALRFGEPVQQWWRVYGLLPGDDIAQVAAKNLLPIDGDDDQAPEQLSKDKPAELTA